MTGVTLLSCDGDVVEFLVDVLENVKAVLESEGLQSSKMIEMNAVKNLLSEVLERYRWRSDDTGADESQSPAEGGSDIGDSDHNTDGPSKEEWDFERLCKWILGQVQATGLEDEKCRAIVDKLEARCGLADAVTAKETARQARLENSPLGEAFEGVYVPCYISLLPVELLQHIFWLAALPHIWVRAPFVLSHVNSHFRTVALDNPSLWIAIDESLPFPILNLYLARSRAKPLNLLTRVDRLYSESTLSADDLFDFLGRESSRIGRMTMTSDTPQPVTAWGKRISQITFTHLTRLAISAIEDTVTGVICPKWACLPGLQDLWLDGCWCRGWVVKPGHSFPRTLRSLRLTKNPEIYPLTLLNALSGVLGLVCLAMEDIALDPDEIVPPTTSRVALGCLEKLEFSNVPVADMHVISRFIATPNLSSLYIRSLGPSDGIADFLATFTAENPQLSSLRILGFNLESQELEMGLHNLVNLTHLHIRASESRPDRLPEEPDAAFSWGHPYHLLN